MRNCVNCISNDLTPATYILILLARFLKHSQDAILACIGVCILQLCHFCATPKFKFLAYLLQLFALGFLHAKETAYSHLEFCYDPTGPARITTRSLECCSALTCVGPMNRERRETSRVHHSVIIVLCKSRSSAQFRCRGFS